MWLFLLWSDNAKQLLPGNHRYGPISTYSRKFFLNFTDSDKVLWTSANQVLAGNHKWWPKSAPTPTKCIFSFTDIDVAVVTVTWQCQPVVLPGNHRHWPVSTCDTKSIFSFTNTDVVLVTNSANQLCYLETTGTDQLVPVTQNAFSVLQTPM